MKSIISKQSITVKRIEDAYTSSEVLSAISIITRISATSKALDNLVEALASSGPHFGWLFISSSAVIIAEIYKEDKPVIIGS